LPRQHFVWLQRDHLLYERSLVDDGAVKPRLAGSARYTEPVQRRGADVWPT
jgi:hypothetical protein